MTIKNSTLTQARLQELLHYDPGTGDFTWLKSRGSAKKGNVAGTINTNGYRHINVDSVSYLAHRLAWFYVNREWPEEKTDHINHIRDDNRIKNLRCVSDSDNCKNKSIRSDNTSGVVGVYLDNSTGKWVSCIFHNGEKIYLCRTENMSLAVQKRKEAETKYGYHKNHGEGGI